MNLPEDIKTLVPDRCPICGRGNACAMARGGKDDAPCWCQSVSIDRGVLSQLPRAARGMACLCADCAAGRPR